ncbi:hypothetical protein P8452_65344 [Trifolium repens]|nr:hypothetical protein P8452_65344 [Trifolium repens]
MLPEGPIPYTKIEFLLGIDRSKPLPEGPEIVTRYEFLEDECEGILELKSETTLVYTGLVRRIVEVDGILAGAIIRHV